MDRYNAILSVLIVASVFSLGFAIHSNLHFLNGFSPNAHASEQGHVGIFIEASNETGSQSNETNQTEPTPSPSGGGAAGGSGGGGGAAYVPFSVTPGESTVNIITGEVYEQKVTVHNFGTTPLRVTIVFTEIEDIASVDNSEIELAPGETREITFLIRSDEVGIYAGKIFFEAAGIRREVLTLINVRTGTSLFDLFLTLPDSYRSVLSGDIVKAFISIVQISSAPQTDVTMTYLIKDFEGNTLSREQETFAVVNKKDYVHDYKTSRLPPGDYMIGVELQHTGGFAASSAHFKVNSKITYAAYALIALVILVVIIFYLRYKKSRAVALGKKRR